MKQIKNMMLLLTLATTLTAGAQDINSFPWLDRSKSFEERAALLVKELTLEEKASQLAPNDHVYNVIGAYVCPASEFDKLPKGIYVLNGHKYIKK